jgi:hypothetical protein
MIKMPILLDGYDLEPSPGGDFLDKQDVIECLRDALQAAEGDSNIILVFVQKLVEYLDYSEE